MLSKNESVPQHYRESEVKAMNMEQKEMAKTPKWRKHKR